MEQQSRRLLVNQQILAMEHLWIVLTSVYAFFYVYEAASCQVAKFVKPLTRSRRTILMTLWDSNHHTWTRIIFQESRAALHPPTSFNRKQIVSSAGSAKETRICVSLWTQNITNCQHTQGNCHTKTCWEASLGYLRFQI
jgi:hypothetical protein